MENNHDFANTYDDKFIYFKKHFKVIDNKTKLLLSADNAWNQEFNRYNFEVKNVEMLKKDEEFKLVLAESEFITATKIGFYVQLLENIDRKVFNTTPWLTLIFLGLGIAAGYRNIGHAIKKSRKL